MHIPFWLWLFQGARGMRKECVTTRDCQHCPANNLPFSQQMVEPSRMWYFNYSIGLGMFVTSRIPHSLLVRRFGDHLCVHSLRDLQGGSGGLILPVLPGMVVKDPQELGGLGDVKTQGARHIWLAVSGCCRLCSRAAC